MSGIFVSDATDRNRTRDVTVINQQQPEMAIASLGTGH